MSNHVDFYEEPTVRRTTSQKDPVVIRWVLKFGIVKTREQAERVLFGAIILALLLSIFLFFSVVTEQVPERYQYNEEEYEPTLDPADPAS